MNMLVVYEEGHSAQATKAADALRAHSITVVEARVTSDRRKGLLSIRSEMTDDGLHVHLNGRLSPMFSDRESFLFFLLQKEMDDRFGGVAAFGKMLVFGVHPLGTALGRLCGKANVPVVLFPSATEILSEPSSKKALKRKQDALRTSSTVVVDAEILHSHISPGKKSAVLSPPLPDGVFSFRPMPMGSSLYMVMVWRWDDELPVVARPKLTIRALAEVERELGRPVTLGIIGGGTRLQELKDYVKGAGLHADFHGELDDAALARELQRADLLLHPADLAVHPHGMLAALRCGVPVLASDVEGMAGHLNGDGNGILVPNRLSAWKQGLLRAVSTDFDRGGIAAANSARFTQREWEKGLLDLVR